MQQMTFRTQKTAGRSRGFTLIELMITVAVVGILAAVAYPSYVKQILRGQRSTGQGVVMDLAQRQEQYFNDNRAYATTAAQLNYTLPPEAVPLYTVNFLAVPGPPAGWIVYATPVPGSNPDKYADGYLVANYTGERYRTKNAPTAASTMSTTNDCTFENGTCVPQ